MALYELNPVQVKDLVNIINEASIKGKSASAIIRLLDALSKPVKEPKKEK